MANNKIHIGNVIKEQLLKQERSAGWLARHINMEASACRKMLNRHAVDTDRLQDISCAMNYDFFALYSNIIKSEIRK